MGRGGLRKGGCDWMRKGSRGVCWMHWKILLMDDGYWMMDEVAVGNGCKYIIMWYLVVGMG